jgi:hypothetical protein
MTAALLESANKALRDAVRERMLATDPNDPKCVGYKVDEGDPEPCGDCDNCEPRLTGDGVMNARSETYAEWVPPAYAREEADDGSPGVTAKFGTGAIRSDTFEELRYDLVSPIGLREVARACAEGAAKYGDWNWEKGMPVHDLLNHAIAHIYGFLSGDRSEPHLGHAAWNLLAAIHSHELWPHLNEGHLRGVGCRVPEAAK